MSNMALSEGQAAGPFPLPNNLLGSELSNLDNLQHLNSYEDTAFTNNSVKNFPPVRGA